MTLQSGTVEKIDFTSGSAGHQWTTIDGVKYATWWDTRTKNWKIGERVTFEPYRAPLWHGNNAVDCARSICKIDREG